MENNFVAVRIQDSTYQNILRFDVPVNKSHLVKIVDPQSHLCCVEADAGLVQTVGEKEIENINLEKRLIVERSEQPREIG